MLTIKHVALSGHETIIQTNRVTADAPSPTEGAVTPKIWYENPDGSTCYFDNGNVFVMNNEGQTVATYRGVNGSGSSA